MVRQTDDDKTDIVKCKITGNSSYNLASAAVIARQYNGFWGKLMLITDG